MNLDFKRPRPQVAKSRSPHNEPLQRFLQGCTKRGPALLENPKTGRGVFGSSPNCQMLPERGLRPDMSDRRLTHTPRHRCFGIVDPSFVAWAGYFPEAKGETSEHKEGKGHTCGLHKHFVHSLRCSSETTHWHPVLEFLGFCEPGTMKALCCFSPHGCPKPGHIPDDRLGHGQWGSQTKGIPQPD